MTTNEQRAQLNELDRQVRAGHTPTRDEWEFTVGLAVYGLAYLDMLDRERENRAAYLDMLDRERENRARTAATPAAIGCARCRRRGHERAD
jgi:hypothetical protein